MKDSRPDPKLADFTFKTYDKVRYGDTDRQGHVNNAVFATFLESGRCEFLDHVFGPDWRKQGGSFVIVRLEVDFRAEIFWPGRVEIGTSVMRVGTSSLRTYQALFQGEKLVATAEGVLVFLDSDKRSRPLQAPEREKLNALMHPCA
ncbi:thioesterase family protein [Acidocella sp.]|uniref:acyl-CoA thioesterase n=1 Tax=Acidocella sp. TaxID=50710 RepID=UPI0026243E17|nr:thioesterase family protein [Acidocella sp.]